MGIDQSQEGAGAMSAEEEWRARTTDSLHQLAMPTVVDSSVRNAHGRGRRPVGYMPLGALFFTEIPGSIEPTRLAKLPLSMHLTRTENPMTGHCELVDEREIVLRGQRGDRAAFSFDPYDDNANSVSITLGVVWALANIAWPLALASVYSRFRPRIRNLRQHISDAKIDRLQREVDILNKQQLGE